MTRFAAVIIAVMALIMAAWHGIARAQDGPNCGGYHQITDYLRSRYHEVNVATGISVKDSMVQLFVSERGTWTIVIVYPNGRACLAMSGDGWTSAPVMPQGRKS